jgi:hypothetical protein
MHELRVRIMIEEICWRGRCLQLQVMNGRRWLAFSLYSNYHWGRGGMPSTPRNDKRGGITHPIGQSVRLVAHQTRPNERTKIIRTGEASRASVQCLFSAVVFFEAKHSKLWDISVLPNTDYSPLKRDMEGSARETQQYRHCGGAPSLCGSLNKQPSIFSLIWIQYYWHILLMSSQKDRNTTTDPMAA